MSAFTMKQKLSIMNYSKLDIYIISAVSKGKKASLEFMAVIIAFCKFLFKRVSSARGRLGRHSFKY